LDCTAEWVRALFMWEQMRPPPVAGVSNCSRVDRAMCPAYRDWHRFDPREAATFRLLER